MKQALFPRNILTRRGIINKANTLIESNNYSISNLIGMVVDSSILIDVDEDLSKLFLLDLDSQSEKLDYDEALEAAVDAGKIIPTSKEWVNLSKGLNFINFSLYFNELPALFSTVYDENKWHWCSDDISPKMALVYNVFTGEFKEVPRSDEHSVRFISEIDSIPNVPSTISSNTNIILDQAYALLLDNVIYMNFSSRVSDFLTPSNPQSEDGSIQSYKLFRAGSEIVEVTTHIITDDVLLVTAEDGVTTAEYTFVVDLN